MTKHRNNNGAVRRLLRQLKWLVPLAVVVGLVALSFVPKPVEIDLGTVARGAMMLTVDDDGETRVRERYEIAAPLAGRLLRIGLDAGDEVKKGDVLATIDPGAPNLLDPRTRAQAEALVNAAVAAVARAETIVAGRKVEAEQLEKSFRRNQVLHEKGNVADAVFEQVEGAYLAAKHLQTAAESAVDIARFELEQAEAALLRTSSDAPSGEDWNFVIASPIDGLILRVYQESSRMLQAGTVLLEIGNPADLEMRIDVLSQDAVKIKAGQKVVVEHWGGEGALSGRVRLVEPSAVTKVSALGVDEQRVDVIADFDAPPTGSETLGDGYRVEARIVIWESADALQVPAGALFRAGEKQAVYRVDGDRAQLVHIEIDHNNGEVAEVLSGLSPGDEVILHPGDRVEDGSLIKPRS